MTETYSPRACPSCGGGLPHVVAKCGACRLVSSPTGSLVEAELRLQDLACADLRGADLRGARLDGARLSGALLSGANLANASLFGADLSSADLRDAVLDAADLANARMHDVRVDGASLHRTRIEIVLASTLRGYRGTPAWISEGERRSEGDSARYSTLRGEPLVCPMCGLDEFAPRVVTLSSRAVAFFDIEWVGRTACALTCRTCLHMLWFAREPQLRAA